MGKQHDRRSQSAATVPIALTIAGSDSSAGAGIQADLKTLSALGVYGLTAVTCIVAEIPGKVSRLEPANTGIVREQIEVLVRNFPIGAMKTGLLCSTAIISAVAEAIGKTYRTRGRRIPLVIDPVMIATSGDRLLEPAAIDAYRDQLFPFATLITPNLDEAGLLLETKIKTRKAMEEAAEALANQYCASILLKGGHLQGDDAIDLLFHKGKLRTFSAPFARGVATHGTGCTYSAAITAGLASGLSLEHAVQRAKKFVTQSIARHFKWKSKTGKIVEALRHSI
ncbi:MAG: bifunctional hydroxymethylpyrimidine kinase/phosphomethylpyrimidine kinase [Verrucomicrobia bacterium]|nr:MAG: bifunctional hydroxymethylpyrimidine kinase/phosphomethylpyrimidine kinase [Verrucomicrobiota bacterium]PYJ34846.1 MAG: bifunctional hydroxymethylpyrimidine kinase/phosphomethylpyrimidine kinase [Verrucomicrobiota bacterium]